MTTVATTPESKYKSFMKPVKFWQKSVRKEIDTNDDDTQPTKVEGQLKSSSMIPSFGFTKKAAYTTPTALTETKKGEVYKLSTIDNTGIYMPPSPSLDGKRDHWIDIDEDLMDFKLPGSECLTTHVGEKHDFFTPSATFVRTQPYIFPVDSCMSDSNVSAVPSFIEDDASEVMTNSCRSSASYL
ncbi:hypothetical protein HPULCUR_001596 [Helicostylum pulchrum]|uniref:Uncharacterized protein n=1 Tax=Helicostylum pulchrum TaxID=562976 RepID=A0ABP9XN67_9FUNG